MRPLCAKCGKEVMQQQGCINRALKAGSPLYCDRVCAGLARRRQNQPTEAERKEAKRAYDARRRAEKRDELCAKKRLHYYANHERIKAEQKAYRDKHMARHVEYCRRPEYKAKKQQYDIAYRARKEFGEFAEAALALRLVEEEVDMRATRYEVYMTNGTLNKAQSRRRSL